MVYDAIVKKAVKSLTKFVKCSLSLNLWDVSFILQI